jgi:hypothetical protein
VIRDFPDSGRANLRPWLWIGFGGLHPGYLAIGAHTGDAQLMWNGFMNKVMAAALREFFRTRTVEVSEFQERRLSKKDKVNIVDEVIFFASYEKCGGEYFFAVVNGGRKTSSRFRVECGWWYSGGVPVEDPYTISEILKAINSSDYSWPKTNLSFNLLRLCHVPPSRIGRGWDMYMSEVWDPSIEEWSRFTDRTMFSGWDSALDKLSSGGPDLQYAMQQAKLIGGDAYKYLQLYGVPFLRFATRCHCHSITT